MTIKDIYTPIEEAKEEIQKRWGDKVLEMKVRKYLRGHIPSAFEKEPRAICTSHVASPNWAFFSFLENSKQAKLKPIVFEFLDDLFVTTNFDKASLAKMVFHHGLDEHGDILTSSRHVINLTGKEEKRKIKEIQTLWGENLVDFHHRAFRTLFMDVEFHDGSEWYHKMGKNAKEYYRYVFALYLRNGVLFENFLLSKGEARFTTEVIIPAFEYVYKEFGMKPLVVPIYPPEQADHKYWWGYPEAVKKALKKPQTAIETINHV